MRLDQANINLNGLELNDSELFEWLRINPPLENFYIKESFKNNHNYYTKESEQGRITGFFDMGNLPASYSSECLTKLLMTPLSTQYEFVKKNSWNKYYYDDWVDEFYVVATSDKPDNSELYNWVARNSDRFQLIVYYDSTDGVVSLMYKVLLKKTNIPKYTVFYFYHHSFDTLRVELFNIPPPFHFRLINSINYFVLNLENANELRKNQGYS